MTTAALVTWLLVPLVPLALWAFASRWSGDARLPQEWGWRGWREARQAGVVDALLRSAGLGAAVAAVATPLGALAGRALGWRMLRRPALPTLLLLLPVVLAPFAVAMGLDIVILRARVPEPVAVVAVLAVFALPYTTFTMRATYQGIDPALEDQARTLGATPAQARRLVTRPAAATGLLTATGLAFLVGWSDYTVTLLIGGGQLVSAPLLLGSSAAGSGNDALTAALAASSSVPPLLVLAVLSLARGRRAHGPDRRRR